MLDQAPGLTKKVLLMTFFGAGEGGGFFDGGVNSAADVAGKL